MGYYTTTEYQTGELRATQANVAENPLRGPIRRVESGYRFYNAALGRWMSRDPIGEQAFFEQYTKHMSKNELSLLANIELQPVYLFVKNSSLNGVDPDGRNPFFAWAVYRAVIGDLSRSSDLIKHCYVSCMGDRGDFPFIPFGSPTMVAGLVLEILQIAMELPRDAEDAIRGFIRDMESNRRGGCCAIQIWRSCEECCSD